MIRSSRPPDRGAAERDRSGHKAVVPLAAALCIAPAAKVA
jgi:hypothetical protein